MIKNVIKLLLLYPVPFNLTYLWNYGSLAAFMLSIQIISGIFLSMYYIPYIEIAFLSVEHIMRNVQYGWFIRYLHANGASFFFITVYIHILRGLYYGSFLKKSVWLSGLFIFLLMILTAFLGYVLPWAQMSYWAATVITNLVSTIPVLGPKIIFLLWGDYTVSGPTLSRFFSLHFVIPFLIVGLVISHVILLHEEGSSNPMGITLDSVPFHSYYTIKDLYGILLLTGCLITIICLKPNLLGHPDNYIAADPCVTPTHIVPEWYFLLFYAILRSVPHKFGGVILLIIAISMLFLITFFPKIIIQSTKFRPMLKYLIWFFVFNNMLLSWIGAKPIEYPFYIIGQFCTIIFFYFFVLSLFYLIIEKEKLYKYIFFVNNK